MKQPIQFPRLIPRFAALILVAMGLAPVPASAQLRGRESSDWVSVWGASPSHLDTEGSEAISYVNGQTIREHVRLSLGGSSIRIRLSNLLGSRELVVGAVHVALHGTGAGTLPGTDHAVNFNDQPSVTIPVGAQVVSDAIPLEVRALEEIAVSVYLPPEDPGVPLTFHPGVATSYISLPGDYTAAEMPVQRMRPGHYLLSAVEVRQAAALTVVTLGDDITDGSRSTVDANHRWPDYLAERLRSQQNATNPVAVVNAGITNNRLLDNARLSDPAGTSVTTGPSAAARFDRDVIAQAHVKWVMVLEGINDIKVASSIPPPPTRTFKEIIGAYKQLIARAHAAGLKIYGCTMIPASFTAANEQLRQDVNSWIRNSGQFDAVVDFDGAIRDPSHPNQILPTYDSGDRRHPNDSGYSTMASAVPLSLLGMAPQIQVPPNGGLYHGVFPAGTEMPDGDISMQAADAYRDAVGRPLAWIYFSNEWYVTRRFPGVTAEAIRARGAVPFIRLHMRSQQRQLVTDPTYTLDRIIAGEFDGDLRVWADGAKAFATPLIVQYGTEVNGDWNPWSAPYNGGLAVGPAKFQKAFRHIVQVMRAEGASNITWALHINGENWPGDDPRNNAGAYYPGDDVVDWIGFSLYQNYGNSDPDCRDLNTLLKGREAELGDAAKKKPLFIFELGTNVLSTQCNPGSWTRQMLQDLLGGRWPELHGFSWWDETQRNRSSVMGVPDNPELRVPFHDVLNGPLAPNLVDRPITR
jgi:lysophospholipase L1-like esterase